MYYLNEKINDLDIKNKIINEFRQNPLVLQQIRSISNIGSRVILCDIHAPLEKICKNRITEELVKGILTDPNPKTEKLRKKIKQLTLENTKKIAKQGLKHFYLESDEKQKLALVFCGFFAALMTTRAIASAWSNIQAGQLFFRSNLAASSIIATSTLIGSILFDEETIINLASMIFRKKQSDIIPVFEQLGFEGKEFTVQALKKRDATLLLCFKKSVFEKATKKISHMSLKDVDTLIHTREYKEIIDDFFEQLIELLYEHSQEGNFKQQIIGHLAFGSNEPLSKRFLTEAVRYIADQKAKFKHVLTTPRHQEFEPIRQGEYEQLFDFSQNPTFLDMIYDFFTRNEIDESCESEESVIVEQVIEEE